MLCEVPIVYATAGTWLKYVGCFSDEERCALKMLQLSKLWITLGYSAEV